MTTRITDKKNKSRPGGAAGVASDPMERPAFGQALRSAREARGLSQAALAKAAGLTAPYLSLLESGQRRPPSADAVARLARALGEVPEAWVERAALERAPDPLRRKFEGLDRERGRVSRARDRLLTTALFNVARSPGLLASVEDEPDLFGPFGQLLRRLAGSLRGFGSAREAQARSAALVERLSAREREQLIEALPEVLAGPVEAPPPGTSAAGRRVALRPHLAAPDDPGETFEVDARWASPSTFAWRVPGEDGWPRLAAGDLLLIDPERAPREGDLVVLRHAGQDLVRRLARLGPEEVRLEGLRPELPPLRLPRAAFQPAGVAVRLVRDLLGG